MPPRRGRPTKNLRMAAAVENMAIMGFEDSLVKSTVKELLEIYTEDGWLFIEENSYSVLRDALLEKTASPPQEEELEPALQQEEGGAGGVVVAESSNLAAIETEQENTKAGAEETVVEAPAQRKPKPYYGWVSKDESGDSYMMELPPMPSNVFEEIWSSLPLVSDLINLDKKL